MSNCRHFATLLCALLRRQGTPARARCGFGTYFEAARGVDHWVCEYWDERAGRWTLVDAQIDALQRSIVKPDFDPLDVPRERFWVAGQAWQRCRDGSADPATFGIADMWGLWFVRGDLRLDVASLNRVELLPWDFWGPPSSKDDATLSRDEWPLLDRLAELTTADAGDMTDLRRTYEASPDLRVPDDMLARIHAADLGEGTGVNPLADVS